MLSKKGRTKLPDTLTQRTTRSTTRGTPKSPPPSTTLQNSTTDNNNRPILTCPLCPATFATKHNYSWRDKHIERAHPGSTPFPCSYPPCTLQFSTLGKLKLHIRTDHQGRAPPPVCGICGRTLVTPAALKAHVRAKHSAAVQVLMKGGGWEVKQKCCFCDVYFETEPMHMMELLEHCVREHPEKCAVPAEGSDSASQGSMGQSRQASVFGSDQPTGSFLQDTQTRTQPAVGNSEMPPNVMAAAESLILLSQSGGGFSTLN